MHRPVYSYSRVNTYFTCPAQFRFRYIERRPSPVADGAELFLGSRFHEVLEHLYRELPKRVPSVQELLQYFKDHWEKHWEQALRKQQEKGFSQPLRIVQPGQTPQDFYEKGRLFLENYYHLYRPFDQDETLGVEMRVAFQLDPKGEFRMQGYIDRLGRDAEGVLWIHDYKTSSRKMSEEDARNEDQLALYQVGLEQHPNFGPKEKVKLLWHFVAFEKDRVESERAPKEIARLKDRFISKIQTIERAKDHPTKPGPLCPWCEYLTVCGDGMKWVEQKRAHLAPKAGEEFPAPPSGPAASPSPAKAAEPVVHPPLAASSGPALPVAGPRKKTKGHPGSQDQLPLF